MHLQIMPASRVKRSSHARRAEAPQATKTPEIQPLPRWTRPRNGDQTAGAFCAAASLALFDQILRGGPDGAEPVFAGCLRHRLALKAADSCARLSRLREDAAALRDAEHLATGGETSPAGRLHRVFRLSAAQPARGDAGLLRAAAFLGLEAAIDSGALAEVAAAAPDPLTAAAQASAAATKLCAPATDAEILAFVVADFALARRLDWPRPVPLLGVAILHPSLRRGAGDRARRPRSTDNDWADSVARAYGLAVVEAHARSPSIWRGGRKSFSPSRRCCARKTRVA
ncbi:MAG: DUF1403 family protein [Hyphomicrobiales bacterium]|nr:MAG: DUF1403 family protein [Hyphomicrobiales bacterium]